jgi:DNA modification methylase
MTGRMRSVPTIIVGDVLQALDLLPDQSVQCIVTSPPYDDLRTYGGYSWDFEKTAHELHRVLCAGGVLCWNVGDSVQDGSETLTSFKQAIYFKEVVGFRVHDTMIYEKLNFGHPEKVRYHQLFEYVFVLSKGAPRCFNPLRDKPNAWAGTGTWGKNTVRERDGSMTARTRNIITEFGMRGNVWRGKTSGQERGTQGSLHPAAMPEWLACDLMLSWSNPGDTVLDPFGGSGTTALVAQRHGRSAILIELNPAYVEIARKRLAA